LLTLWRSLIHVADPSLIVVVAVVYSVWFPDLCIQIHLSCHVLMVATCKYTQNYQKSDYLVMLTHPSYNCFLLSEAFRCLQNYPIYLHQYFF